MNDRPTPETDAFAVKFKSVCGSKAWVPIDICRRFERDRDNARSVLREIAEASGFDNIGNWARNRARQALEEKK